MTTATRRQIAWWTILTMLAGLAVPALAETPAARATVNLGLADLYAAGELRLDVGKVLEGGRLSLELRHDTAADGEAGPVATAEHSRQAHQLDARTVAYESWRAAEQSELLRIQAAPKQRSFGRWLKKYWYVPVLAAAAVGVAVADDDSDGPGDDDD